MGFSQPLCDSEHRHDQEENRYVRPPKPIETPSVYDAANDDRDAGCAKRANRSLKRHPAVRKQRDEASS
jgi:hypothetical protein